MYYHQGGIEVVELQGRLKLVVSVSGYLDGKFFEVCSRVNMVSSDLNFDFGDTYNFVDLLERQEKLGDETAVW